MSWPRRKNFRNNSNWCLAQVSELAHPLLKLWTRVRSSRSPSPPAQWRKALLIGSNHIGDVLYNTASLPFLAQGLPQCSFHFMAPEPAAGALDHNPHLNRIHRFSRPVPGSEEEKLLIDECYDAILCYNSGYHIADLLFAARTGIPNRIGYAHKGFSGLLTYPLRPDSFQPFPSYFRGLVSQLTGFPPTWSLRPLLYPQLSNFAETCLLPPCDRQDVAFFVTTRQPDAKKWPTERFVELGQWLQEVYPVRIVLSGASVDREELENLRSKIGGACVVNAGLMSLLGLAAWLRQCRMAFALDSAGRHLANAANLPVFYFRNLRSRASETGSYLENEVDLCPPNEFVNPMEQQILLDSISFASVQKKVEERFPISRSFPDSRL